ncbi:MAG: nucleotidyltransferase substrate binding protein [Oscillospiraceae bacterium]|nr:nucleotidyltransferase substrate binding protein [Oscillospiraceae bacterium]
MKKYENFCRAYKNLEESIILEPPYDTVTLTGLVALFEITFEQSWKMIKEILEYHGYEQSNTGSPRIVIKTAFQAGMIDDEETWLMALAARNNVAHSYNEDIALSIVRETKEIYVSMFKKLKEIVEKAWIK